MKKVIYFHNKPLNPNANRASELRPYKMYQYFLELGCEVELITGYSKQRMDKIKDIKQRIENGEAFDVLYIENRNIPYLISDPDHIPRNLFFDIRFFKYCKNKGIKVVHFYRDFFWKFSFLKKTIRYKVLLLRVLNEIELWLLSSSLDYFLVPTKKFKDVLPGWFEPKVLELPPGHDLIQAKHCDSNVINIIYVGGLGPLYPIEDAIKSIMAQDNMKLFLVCREEEFRLLKTKIEIDPARVEIVHANSTDLRDLYSKMDYGLLAVKPFDYWNYANPVKLYEYVGYGLPIIATKGTLVGDIVKENNIGIELSDISSLRNINKPNDMMLKNVASFAQKTSWIERCKFVLNLE